MHDEECTSPRPKFRPLILLVMLWIILAIGAGVGTFGFLFIEKQPNFGRGIPALALCIWWSSLVYRGIKKMQNEAATYSRGKASS
jgi:hypothetical protein